MINMKNFFKNKLIDSDLHVFVCSRVLTPIKSALNFALKDGNSQLRADAYERKRKEVLLWPSFVTQH